MSARYEALINNESSKNGVDEILADAADRAGKAEHKSTDKEFGV